MAGCFSASVWAELLHSVTHFPRQQESLPGRVKKQPLAAAAAAAAAATQELSPPPPFPVSLSSPWRVLSPLSTSPLPCWFSTAPPRHPPLLPSLSVAPRFAQLPPSTAASLNESLMRLWVVRTTAPSEAWLISLRRGDGAQRYCSRQGIRRCT